MVKISGDWSKYVQCDDKTDCQDMYGNAWERYGKGVGKCIGKSSRGKGMGKLWERRGKSVGNVSERRGNSVGKVWERPL